MYVKYKYLILWSWPLSIPSVSKTCFYSIHSLDHPIHTYCVATCVTACLLTCFFTTLLCSTRPCPLLPRPLLADSNVSPNNQECRFLGLSIEFKCSRSRPQLKWCFFILNQHPGCSETGVWLYPSKKAIFFHGAAWVFFLSKMIFFVTLQLKMLSGFPIDHKMNWRKLNWRK